MKNIQTEISFETEIEPYSAVQKSLIFVRIKNNIHLDFILARVNILIPVYKSDFSFESFQYNIKKAINLNLLLNPNLNSLKVAILV